jgi:hypothetical protein
MKKMLRIALKLTVILYLLGRLYELLVVKPQSKPEVNYCSPTAKPIDYDWQRGKLVYPSETTRYIRFQGKYYTLDSLPSTYYQIKPFSWEKRKSTQEVIDEEYIRELIDRELN